MKLFRLWRSLYGMARAFQRCREGPNIMAHLLQNLRYALRQMRRAPGFAFTAILTLAIGIGATTAIFSFVDGILLQPLAYRDGGKLVTVWERVPFLETMSPLVGPNPRHVLRWRQSQTSFSDMALVNEGTTGVAIHGDHPRYVGRVRVEPNLLSVLGVHPLLGRDFLSDEGTTGRADRVLISWNLWHHLLGGTPDVLGKTLEVGGAPVTVIGVLPQDFYFPKSNELVAFGTAGQSPAVDLFVPEQVDGKDFGWNSDYGNFAVIGRLRPGVTPTAAQAQLDSISNAIVHEAPAGQFEAGAEPPLSTVVQTLKQSIVGHATTGLYLLLAAVFSVLLVACINLANAQLARVAARNRESALRTALGASAWQLVQSSLLESILLAVAGTSLGIVLASIAVHRFAGVVHVAMPRASNITLNPTVLLMSICCTVGATVLFGLLPSLHSLRARTQFSLGSAGRSTGSSAGTNLRRVLIGAQVLACTALLLLTTLFARNLLQLLHGDMGFHTGGTLQADTRLQGKAFSDAARANFEDGMIDRLGNLPGVSSAALVSSILGQGELWGDGLQPTGAPESRSLLAQVRWVSPAYFQTVGQSIIEGRALNAGDRIPVTDSDAPSAADSKPIAAVLSQTLAAALWPHQDPLERTFTRHSRTYRVVGVAEGARTNSPHEAPVGMAYLPYWDNPPYQPFFLVHQASGDPATLIPSVRQAIYQQDPTVIIANIRPLSETFADTLAPERLQTTLLGAFGTATLLLSLLGMYGTLNYATTRRTQEFGIRMALGASRLSIYWASFQEILLPVTAGILSGWIISVAATRIVRSLLDTAPSVPLSAVVAVVGVLGVATLLATWLPCRRAARLEPMEALRTE